MREYLSVSLTRLRRWTASLPGFTWIVNGTPSPGRRRAFDAAWRRARALRLMLSGAFTVSLVAAAAFVSPTGDPVSQNNSSSEGASVSETKQVERQAVHGIAVTVRPEVEDASAGESASAAQREAGAQSRVLANAQAMNVATATPAAGTAAADSALASAAQGARVEVPEHTGRMGAGAHGEEDDGGGFFSNVTISTGRGGQACSVPR